jgi:hypothetical protein
MDITRPVLVSELPEETVIEFTLVEKKFNHLSKQYTAGALFDLLMRQKNRGTSQWWNSFNVVKVERADVEEEHRWHEVRLQCTTCERLFTTSNPSATCKQHLSGGEWRHTQKRRLAVSAASWEGSDPATIASSAGVCDAYTHF